jgi:hypothetical protein
MITAQEVFDMLATYFREYGRPSTPIPDEEGYYWEVVDDEDDGYALDMVGALSHNSIPEHTKPYIQLLQDLEHVQNTCLRESNGALDPSDLDSRLAKVAEKHGLVYKNG